MPRFHRVELPLVLVLAAVALVSCGPSPDRIVAPTFTESPVVGGAHIQSQPVKPLIPAAPDVFVVKIAPGTDPKTIANRNGWTLERELSGGLAVFSAILNTADLDNDNDVVSYEQNQVAGLAFGQELTMGFFEGDTYDPGDLRGNISTFSLGSSWATHPASGWKIRVGVIDTGADAEHPLLKDRIVKPTGADWLGWEDAADSIDNDNDGLIDEAYGHGTFVAGVVAQLAPSAKIIPVRALNSDGYGSLADVLSAMDALGQQGIDVLNLSLSLSSPSALFEEKLLQFVQAGIWVVAAAGNQGSTTAYPASSPLVLGVAALDTTGALAAFSNSGPDCELAAPGVGILSAFPDNRVGWGDGTSFSAPIITAVVAASVSYGGDAVCMLEGVQSMAPLKYGQLVSLACLPEPHTWRRRHVRAE